MNQTLSRSKHGPFTAGSVSLDNRSPRKRPHQYSSPANSVDLSVLAVLDACGVAAVVLNRADGRWFETAAARAMLGAALGSVCDRATQLIDGLPAVAGTLLLPCLFQASGMSMRLEARCLASHGGGVVVVIESGQPIASPQDVACRWGLTLRERQVAQLIAAGEPTKAIASRLDISIHTARRHSEKVFAKLGVSRRAQVARAWGVNGAGA